MVMTKSKFQPDFKQTQPTAKLTRDRDYHYENPQYDYLNRDDTIQGIDPQSVSPKLQAVSSGGRQRAPLYFDDENNIGEGERYRERYRYVLATATCFGKVKLNWF